MKKKAKISLWRVVKRTFPLGMKYERWFFLLVNALAVVHAVSWGFTVFARQWFFDSVSNAAAGAGKFSFAILMLGVFGLVVAAQQALNGAANFLMNQWWMKFSAQMKRLVARKAGRVRYLSP